MPRRGLTTEWSIDVEESFVGRVVDEDLQLVSSGPPVRTIWVAIWSARPERSPAEQLAEIRRQPHTTAPKERFVEPGAEPGELRYAGWYPEDVDGAVQWALYAYTVRAGSYVQLACIGDSPDDRDWALATWRSLRYEPAGDDGDDA